MQAGSTNASRLRRPTILDVAELAGVSTATVSRVLNGASPVSEATRQRVEAAVASLHYRPSDLTRAVFAGRSNTIGVLVADLRNPYYIDLVDGISQVSSAAGTLPYLASGSRDRAHERRILELMDSHRVRGLITTVAHDNDDVILGMAEAGTVCVNITRQPSVTHPRMHSIRLDDAAAGRLAWEHLAGIGRRRVLVVNQPTGSPTILERTASLFEAAHASGSALDAASVHELQSMDAPDDTLVTRLRESFADGSIDAVFATTGISTFRAYEALVRSGLRVPEEMPILGFDDFAWAEYLSAPLSVIVQPTARMGATAAEVILDEPGETLRLTFSPSLVARASTALAPV